MPSERAQQNPPRVCVRVRQRNVRTREPVPLGSSPTRCSKKCRTRHAKGTAPQGGHAVPALPRGTSSKNGTTRPGSCTPSLPRSRHARAGMPPVSSPSPSRACHRDTRGRRRRDTCHRQRRARPGQRAASCHARVRQRPEPENVQPNVTERQSHPSTPAAPVMNVSGRQRSNDRRGSSGIQANPVLQIPR
jgi:hypothetical protein